MPQAIKRPVPLSIRLSVAERADLERRAAGASLSSFVKDALFSTGSNSVRNDGVQVANRVLLAHILAALGASNIAPNLDRLRRSAEWGELDGDEATIRDLRQACDDIRVMHNALMRGLGLKEAAPSRREQGIAAAFNVAAKQGDQR